MVNKKPLIINLESVSANLRTYLVFVKLVESLLDNPDDYKDLIHLEAEFTELPNLVNRQGQVRNFSASMEGLTKAKTIIAEQTFKIVGFSETAERLVVEKVWTGIISTDIGNLTKGQELKAYICAVVEFKDGKIYRHRSYDCYEPFN